MIGFTSPLNLCLPAESKMREYEIEDNCKPGDNTCSKSKDINMQ